MTFRQLFVSLLVLLTSAFVEARIFDIVIIKLNQTKKNVVQKVQSSVYSQFQEQLLTSAHKQLEKSLLQTRQSFGQWELKEIAIGFDTRMSIGSREEQGDVGGGWNAGTRQRLYFQKVDQK